MVSECDMISSEPCALVGPVSRVYGVCHVPGFGFWGVTGLVVDEKGFKPSTLWFIAVMPQNPNPGTWQTPCTRETGPTNAQGSELIILYSDTTKISNTLEFTRS
ncbi:hypothetical protein SLEP1_g3660 [Rubroshorea leprosula]|uniref:Uncharacterized protein n=1 Tax=Rubroshorea leprosula TaxID=152421 RepID=A0AAV5HVH1_9ROSI|nr:hypothetical protein SLEP1_g3660 [Rubroshorea leprosula]